MVTEMTISFENKIAIVTGAGGGIGAATARRLAGLGAKVALTDLNEDRVHEVAASMEEEGAEVFAAKLDVTDYDAFLALVANVVKRWGGVDILANVAGGAMGAAAQPIEQMPMDAYDSCATRFFTSPIMGSTISPMAPGPKPNC